MTELPPYEEGCGEDSGVGVERSRGEEEGGGGIILKGEEAGGGVAGGGGNCNTGRGEFEPIKPIVNSINI